MSDNIAKTHALLEHMYHHNVEHTEELEEIRDKLIEIGDRAAATKASDAIKLYIHGNELLKEALEVLN